MKISLWTSSHVVTSCPASHCFNLSLHKGRSAYWITTFLLPKKRAGKQWKGRGTKLTSGRVSIVCSVIFRSRFKLQFELLFTFLPALLSHFPVSLYSRICFSFRVNRVAIIILRRWNCCNYEILLSCRVVRKKRARKSRANRIGSVGRGCFDVWKTRSST